MAQHTLPHETEYKSSTKAELLRIDEAMTQVIWTRYFLGSQGVYVPTTTSTRTTQVSSFWWRTENVQFQREHGSWP